MKHIIQFSGGCASAYVAYLVSLEFPLKDIILLRHNTFAECPDTERFINEVSELLHIPITEVNDGRSLWEVIYDNNMLPSDRFRFCTRILKQEPAEKFLSSITDDYILYNGFGVKEWRRVQRSLARAEALGRVVKSPLYDLKISDEFIRDTIKNHWRICLPDSYRYLSHNNCIPCFVSHSKSHFKSVAKYYPEEYEKAIKAEEHIGFQVFENISLRSLRSQAFSNLDLFDLQESIPCMCAL